MASVARDTPGGEAAARERRRLVWLLAPTLAVFAAFWLLPIARLTAVGAGGPRGVAEYFAVVTNPNYFASLVSTVVLSFAVTVVTLVIAATAGLFLERNRFAGRSTLIALLTFPLAFPGVVVGFMVIMLAGRQGLIGDTTEWLTGERVVFAYSMAGLFLGYLYFSIPRVILTIMAAAEKLDPKLEEAARALGASPWRRTDRCDRPGTRAGAAVRRGDLVRDEHGCLWHRVYVGHQDQRVAHHDLYRVHELRQFRYRGQSVDRAGHHHLGGAGTGALTGGQQRGGGRMSAGIASRRGLRFWLQLAFTLLVCLFLVAPVVLSVLAGLSENFFVGVKSGLTLRWVFEVWELYANTVYLSMLLAVATLVCTLVLGVPAAYVLARVQNRFTRLVEELLVLPVAVPGLATALALILFYGTLSGFRTSWTFILVGHVLFTLPFMVRSVVAVMAAIDLKTLEEAAASLGASFRERFFGVILPNAKPGILAGSLMVVTLSMGEFNITWMLHTPLTKTLPVGLADSYASMRLEIGSAYTIVFFFMIVPLLVAMQWLSNRSAASVKRV